MLFSRKLWPNEAMPLFSALLALALVEAVAEGRQRGVLLAGLWLGVLVNLHVSGILFVPVALGALLLRPRLLWSRAALGSAGTALAVSAPLLVHELQRGWPGLQALRSAAGGAATADTLAIEHAATLIGPRAWAVVAGDAGPDFDALAWSSDWLDGPGATFLVVGVAVALARLAVTFASRRRPGASGGRAKSTPSLSAPPSRGPDDRPAERGQVQVASDWRAIAAVLIWLIVPLAVSSRRVLPFQAHYLIPLIPAIFLFAGLGIAAPVLAARRWLPSRRSLLLAAAIPAGYLAWSAAVQVQHFEAFYHIVETAGARTLYGSPLAHRRAALDHALALGAGRPIAFVMGAGSDGDGSLPLVLSFLAPEVDLRVAGANGQVVLGVESALYVVAPSAEPTARELLGRVGRTAGPSAPLPGSPRGYDYFFVAAGELSTGVSPLARLENGLALVAVDLPGSLAPGAPVPLVARWRVQWTPEPGESALFFHLLDERGNGIAGQDRAGLQTGDLLPGSEILSWAVITTPRALPPGRYWLDAGVYSAREVRRVPVLDRAGAPAGDAIRLGPLKVPVPPAAPAESPPLALFGDGVTLEAAAIGIGQADELARQPAIPGGIGAMPVVARAGDRIAVELAWRVNRRPARAYTVFVHVVDASGWVLAQHDGEPMNQAYPTPLWDRGERIVDLHTIGLPSELPPGRYEVLAGLYDRASLVRIGRIDADGDSAEVGNLDVRR